MIGKYVTVENSNFKIWLFYIYSLLYCKEYLHGYSKTYFTTHSMLNVFILRGAL